MMAARLDVSATIAQQTAKAGARDHARSAVLGRHDAADARRQFSLDEAAEARTDRAARSRAEPRDSAADRTTAADRPSTVPASSRTEPPNAARAAPTPPSVASGQAAAGRPAPATSVSESIAAKVPTAATGDTASIEAVSTAEAAPPVETAATIEVAVTGAVSPPPAPVPQQNAVPTPGPATADAETTAAATPAAAASGAAVEIAVPGEDAGSPVSNGTASNAAPTSASFTALLDVPTDPAPPPEAGAVSSAPSAPKGAEAPTAPSAPQAAAQPVPLGAVPMTIALRSLQDASRFEIRLDPLDLGRIDVTLDIDKQAGTVSADLVVDRPATLALLQRDAGALQEALAQAGLDAGSGISLSLRDGAAGGQNSGGSAARGQAGTTRGAHSSEPADITESTPQRALRLSGIDIRI